MKDFGIWLIGVGFGMALIGIYELSTTPTSDEMQRDYDAYRECIPKPGCMKALDYIDYYELKWKLEDDHE